MYWLAYISIGCGFGFIIGYLMGHKQGYYVGKDEQRRFNK